MSDTVGWHPDPSNPTTWAYWDGTQWLTDGVAASRGHTRPPTAPGQPSGPPAGAAWSAPGSPPNAAAPGAPPAPGWWRASDGNWYPPAQQAGWVPAPTPPGYQAPYGYVPAVAPRTNGYAIAAMVLGIVWIYGIGSILALIFGYKSRRAIDQSQGTQTGRGMAIAGIVLGWIGVAGIALIITVAAIAASSSSDGDINTDPSNGSCNPDRYMQDPDCG